jgi:hypothetical protein
MIKAVEESLAESTIDSRTKTGASQARVRLGLSQRTVLGWWSVLYRAQRLTRLSVDFI